MYDEYSFNSKQKGESPRRFQTVNKKIQNCQKLLGILISQFRHIFELQFGNNTKKKNNREIFQYGRH